MRQALFLIFLITMLGCGETETEPDCGEIYGVDIPNIIIDTPIDQSNDNFVTSDGVLITVEGLPDGVQLDQNEQYASFSGSATEAGKFTVVLTGVDMDMDKRCEIESVTKILIVADKPVECDEDLDCRVILWDDSDCVNDASCDDGERCFAVADELNVCDSAAVCGGGTVEVLYPLVDGTKAALCLHQEVDLDQCNERGHCF